MRVFVVLLLVASAAAATQHTPQGPTPLEQSQCWDCHAPNLWDPPMQDLDVGLRVQGDARLELRLGNPWAHEVSDVRAVAKPVTDWGFAGTGNVTSKTHSASVAYDPMEDTQMWVSFEVPDGTQSAVLVLQDESRFEHELHMEVYGPDGVLELGAGGVGDTVRIDAHAIAAAGWGTYHAKVVRSASATDTPEDAQVTLEVHTDTTPTDAMVVGARTTLAQGETVILAWPLLPENGTGDLLVDVYWHTHYDHEAESDPDDADIMTSVPVTLHAQDGVVRLAQDTQVEDKDESIPGFPLALGIAACTLLALAARGPRPKS